MPKNLPLDSIVLNGGNSVDLPPLDIEPFGDFETASRTVLAYLHRRLGFELWMMTRTEGADWIVLQTEDHGYNVKEGTVFRWADSFCAEMVAGAGPRVAPCVQDIPAYVAAPIGQQVPIGAYMGVPVTKSDGSFFGTLCAIDPNPKKDSIRDDLPLVELFAKLLGSILSAELKAVEQARLLERSQKHAMTDALTGLLNRRGWDQNIAAEEERARRYGSPTSVLIIDLDGLKHVNDTQGHAGGDALLRRASDCIRSALRENDIVARTGGDEFSILCIECNPAECDTIFKKISGMLLSSGIGASIGKAMRGSRGGLIAAIADADRAMYAAKAEHKASRHARGLE